MAREHFERRKQDVRHVRDMGTSTDGADGKIEKALEKTTTVAAESELKQPSKSPVASEERIDSGVKLPIAERQLEVQKSESGWEI